jgi:electron transfer flavoprotein alpha subunit
MDFSFLDDWEEEEVTRGPLAKAGESYRNIWVSAETAHGGLLPSTLEAVGQARDLADQIGVYVYGVLLGQGVESLAQDLITYGADMVLVADDPALAEYHTETWVQILANLVEECHPEILLVPATPLGNDLAPRLAQRLKTGLISHCIRLGLDMSERLLLGTFCLLGGEVYHTMACPIARPQMATLQPGYFALPYVASHRSGDVYHVDVDLSQATDQAVWIEYITRVALPQVPLAKASVVVSAGRGMGDADGFDLVVQLAQALRSRGAANGDEEWVAVAGSRGAYDEGWITEDQIVGVGGTFIAPDLYMACGISGDIHHYFGLQEAKFIVAINPDENAPIMKIANMAVVGDARAVIPAMLEALAG